MKRYLPTSVKIFLKRIQDLFFWNQRLNQSWSQEGEDLILHRIFKGKKNGFFVDVGAHHPQRFSNTQRFYKMGWTGINIDAMPGSMKLFDKLRPKDINLEMGVAEQEGTLDYFRFNEPALNGFSAELSTTREKEFDRYFIKDVVQVKVMPLRDILDRYVRNQAIDFLSVDAEGLDIEVLRSNDWQRFRPRIVLAEVLQHNLDNLHQSPLVQFMNSQGYSPIAKLYHTVLFEDALITAKPCGLEK